MVCSWKVGNYHINPRMEDRMAYTEEQQFFWELIGEMFRIVTWGDRKYVSQPLNEINPDGGDNIRNQIVRARHGEFSGKADDESVVFRLRLDTTNTVTMWSRKGDGQMEQKVVDICLFGLKEIKSKLMTTIPPTA